MAGANRMRQRAIEEQLFVQLGQAAKLFGEHREAVAGQPNYRASKAWGIGRAARNLGGDWMRCGCSVEILKLSHLESFPGLQLAS
jgi:hypothetical protein